MMFTVLIVFSILFACGKSSTGVGNNLEDLTLEVQKGRCVARLDTLLFLINGIVYECDGNILGAELVEMLPDSLLSCPVFDVRYTIDYDSKAFLIICPNGHGGFAASLE